MKRIRLAAALAAFLPGMVAGCTSFGDGSFMSRLHPRRGTECACEEGFAGPCCDGPPMAGGMVAGPALPPPGVAEPGVPPLAPLAPAPRILTEPAQPVPAGPTSRIR
jgi:hypothetical protein